MPIEDTDEELLIGYDDEPVKVSPYAGMSDVEIYKVSVKTYLTGLAERTLDFEAAGFTTVEALAANVTLDIFTFCL